MDSFKVLFFILLGLVGITVVAWMQRGKGLEGLSPVMGVSGLTGKRSSDSSFSDVASGRDIFFGKGRCGLCHTIGVERGGKCPSLDYAGDRLTVEYIRESVMQPQAYIRLDFDPPQPRNYPARMPQINQPPIGLTKKEIQSVIGFVQSQRGSL